MKTTKTISTFILMSFYSLVLMGLGLSSCGDGHYFEDLDPECVFDGTHLDSFAITDGKLFFPRNYIQAYNTQYYNSLFPTGLNSLSGAYQEGDLNTGNNLAHATISIDMTSGCLGEHTQEYWVDDFAGYSLATEFHNFDTATGRGDVSAILKSDVWRNYSTSTYENYFYVMWNGTADFYGYIDFGMGYIISTNSLSNARQSLIIKPENAFIYINGIKTTL